MTPPCIKGCPGRSATCHATCEKYAEYQRKMQRARELRRQEGEAVGAYCEGALRKGRLTTRI